MCKCQEPKVEQRLKMQEPTVEITVPQSAERSQALDKYHGTHSRWIFHRSKVAKSFQQDGEIGKEINPETSQNPYAWTRRMSRISTE